MQADQDQQSDEGEADAISQVAHDASAEAEWSASSPCWSAPAPSIAPTFMQLDIAGALKGGILGSSIGAAKKLSEAEVQAVAALLHDRMTETVLRHPDEAAGLFRTLDARPLETVDVIGAGKAALEKANTELGLAMSDDEIDYLLDVFTKIEDVEPQP